MVKNKLEKKFSESVANDSRFIWHLKLHNNPLSHQTTPADFLLHYKDITHDEGGIFNTFLRAVLVECKQVTCGSQGTTDYNGRLAFKRLKQMHDLLVFKNLSNSHKAFFCIAYKEPFWANSDVYLVPAGFMNIFVETGHLESLSRANAASHFVEYKIDFLSGTLFNLSKIYEI